MSLGPRSRASGTDMSARKSAVENPHDCRPVETAVEAGTPFWLGRKRALLSCTGPSRVATGNYLPSVSVKKYDILIPQPPGENERWQSERFTSMCYSTG